MTLPKSFRDELGIKEGEIARIKKVGQRLVLETREVADYETYSDSVAACASKTGASAYLLGLCKQKKTQGFVSLDSIGEARKNGNLFNFRDEFFP